MQNIVSSQALHPAFLRVPTSRSMPLAPPCLLECMQKPFCNDESTLDPPMFTACPRRTLPMTRLPATPKPTLPHSPRLHRQLLATLGWSGASAAGGPSCLPACCWLCCCSEPLLTPYAQHPPMQTDNRSRACVTAPSMAPPCARLPTHLTTFRTSARGLHPRNIRARAGICTPLT